MRTVVLGLSLLFGCQSSLDALELGRSELVPWADNFAGGAVLRANRQNQALLVWMNDFGSTAPSPTRPLGLLYSEHGPGGWLDPAGPADALMWTEPSPLPPRAALSENGDVVIIGFNSDGSSVFHRVAGVWQPPFSLPFSGPTQVEIDDSGNVVIAYVGGWDCGSLRCSGVFRSEFRAGQWSHPASTADAIGMAPPAGATISVGIALAVAGGGEAALAWAQEDFVGTGTTSVTQSVFVSERGPNGWRDPSVVGDRISRPGNMVFGAPQVGLGSGGDLVALWRDLQHGLRVVERRGNQLGLPSLLAAGPSIQAHELVVAPDGTTSVAFTAPGTIGLLEYRGGVWSTILPDAAGWKIAAEKVGVAGVAGGSAALLWSGREGNYARIYRAARTDSGWVLPRDAQDYVSPPDADADYPVAAMGSDTFVAWIEMRGFRPEWSPPFQLRRYWISP